MTMTVAPGARASSEPLALSARPTRRRLALARASSRSLNGAATASGYPNSRKLARDVYARHEALIYNESLSINELDTMTPPLHALHTWCETGLLPTEYQTGGALAWE